MRNLVIFITGTLAAVAIFVAVYAGHHFYKEAQFRSYLKAVGLPTETGYMGGDYPKWEPMEFTYKKYRGTPGIDDPEFGIKVAVEHFIAGNCQIPPITNIWRLTPEEINVRAETDPDAMYYKYFFAENRGDNETAMQYLRKAASLGHVVASIDLTGHMDDYPDERARILDAYSKITPYAEYKRTSEMFSAADVPRISEVARGSNQYPWILVFLYPPHNEQYSTDTVAMPGYREYLCEAYYRGCTLGALPAGIKCGE